MISHNALGTLYRKPIIGVWRFDRERVVQAGEGQGRQNVAFAAEIPCSAQSLASLRRLRPVGNPIVLLVLSVSPFGDAIDNDCVWQGDL